MIDSSQLVDLILDEGVLTGRVHHEFRIVVQRDVHITFKFSNTFLSRFLQLRQLVLMSSTHAMTVHGILINTLILDLVILGLVAQLAPNLLKCVGQVLAPECPT